MRGPHLALFQVGNGGENEAKQVRGRWRAGRGGKDVERRGVRNGDGEGKVRIERRKERKGRDGEETVRMEGGNKRKRLRERYRRKDGNGGENG